jgi:O-antigen ligase
LTSPTGTLRQLYVVPLALFVYGIALTYSRGAFVSLLAGLGAFLVARYGGRKTVAISVIGGPLLFLLFAGRQTDLSTSHGTGQTRIQLWSDWLTEFRSHPFMGKGMSVPEEAEEAKIVREVVGHRQVAHNSYLHAFAELGFLGGMLFIGTLAFALASLYVMRPAPGADRDLRPGPARTLIVDPELRRFHAYLVGALAAYATGLLSLTLCYQVQTYMLVGLAVAYVRVTRCYPAEPAVRFDLQSLGRLMLVSVAFLLVIYLVIQLFVRW